MQTTETETYIIVAKNPSVALGPTITKKSYKKDTNAGSKVDLRYGESYLPSKSQHPVDLRIHRKGKL